MTSRVISGCLNYTFQQFSSVRRILFSLPTRLVEDGGNGIIRASGGPEVCGTLGLQQIRFRMKDYFRRPSEYKRIAKHGWKKRMSTPAGRMVIMRRLLKGRHVLTH